MKMTQAHLAGIAGVSEKTVRRAESGERMQPDSVRALCAALGLDASDLRSEAEINPRAGAEAEARLAYQTRMTKIAFWTLSAGFLLTVSGTVFRQNHGVLIAFGLFAVAAIIAGFVGAVIALLTFFGPTRRIVTSLPGMARLGAGVRAHWGTLASTCQIVLYPLLLGCLPFLAEQAIKQDDAMIGVAVAISAVMLVPYSLNVLKAILDRDETVRIQEMGWDYATMARPAGEAKTAGT